MRETLARGALLRSTNRRCDNMMPIQMLMQNSRDFTIVGGRQAERAQSLITQGAGLLSGRKVTWDQQKVGGKNQPADILRRPLFSCFGRNGAGVAGPTLPSFAVLGITDFNR